MTPDEVVFSTLCESGIAGTKNAWPMGGAPALPWFIVPHANNKRGNIVKYPSLLTPDPVFLLYVVVFLLRALLFQIQSLHSPILDV